MGPKATTALKKFQSDRGLPATGTLDEKTTEMLASKKASVVDDSTSMEEIDWADTIKKDTVEAYFAFKIKYPATRHVRVLSGELSSRLHTVNSAPVWGVCINGKLVADGISTDEIIQLQLADAEDAYKKEARSASSMGVLRVKVKGRTLRVKTIPNANLILKNIDGSWKIVTVAPPAE
jgi:hypothetical protein